MIAALLRLGPICLAISSALAQGMLAGIGVLISTSQFLIMVDDMSASPGREFSGIINLCSLPEAIWKGVNLSINQTATQLASRCISHYC
jgi:hypothetical protein